MIEFSLRRNDPVQRILDANSDIDSIGVRSIDEKVKVLIVRDLLRLGWDMTINAKRVTIQPPASYDKSVIKDSMQVKRQESLLANEEWINKHLDLARCNLAEGKIAWTADIEPVIEVCQTQEQHDIFRILRFYWSSPYSEYVGRRVKLIIRDASLASKPVIGIAALGSSIIHIPERDTWIGWNTVTRTRNIVYTMDAYVLGALPPYNMLLGGKLISYIVASNEVRKAFANKYKSSVTLIQERKANDLACIFTTSLYGRSSQYNRLKYNSTPLFIPIGSTKGYGSFHLTDETFNSMRDLLKSHHLEVTNRFGDGPIWRMRVIRTAADVLGFDADFLLRHSFKRGIYAVPLAENFKQFLMGENRKPKYFNRPLNDLTDYWHERWLTSRKKNEEVAAQVALFTPSHFNLAS